MATAPVKARVKLSPQYLKGTGPMKGMAGTPAGASTGAATQGKQVSMLGSRRRAGNKRLLKGVKQQEVLFLID
jgi:hypothetical protein